MIIYGIFLILVLWTVPSTSLVCYTCNCPAFNTSACDCSATIPVEVGAHCTIIEDFDPSNRYLELSSAFLNSSYSRIKDPYYIIVDESIFYNESTTTWETKTKRVVYGCDWDLCNRYALISSLPNTFNLSIDSDWLTENIYGSGSINSCYTCENEICGNETNPIDLNLCSPATCNNSTTCSLRDLWQDLDTNELCYQSQCTSSLSTDEFDEKYKVQIEAIVYLAQNRTIFDIWEIDINCAAENCSRSTIFQEIKPQIQGEVSNLTNFPSTRPTTTAPPPTTTTTQPDNPIYCYKCSCIGATCPCSISEANSADKSYCSITRSRSGQNVYIDYGHIFINSTYFYVREYPYVLITESITYNELSGQWDTQPEYVIYGCNWNLCNRPELVPYITSSFTMRLSESWLNANVLGTGQPTRDCHECTDGTVCSNTDFIDGDLCPIQQCNTTCLVSDRFDDPTHTEQCYDSHCAPEDDAGFVIETHRVDIEGILYPSTPDKVEVWEIDIYCRADNCSRPEIFQEIRSNLTVHTNDLSIIFNQTVEIPKLRCFDCYCSSEENCTCDTVSTVNAASTFCTIARNYDGTNVNIYFTNNEIGTSYANIHEFPFVLAEQSILYNNETGQWYTRPNKILYGCNWDYCNRLSLLPLLSTSLQMTLPALWLNNTILGTGQSVHDCHECGNNSICSINSPIDGSSCPTQSCNTTCFVMNTNVNVTTNEQCYTSYCVPQDSEELPQNQQRVEIKGVIYGSSPPNTVELWEIYAYCRVDNCSRPEIFQEITQNLIVQTGNLSELFDQSNIDQPDQLSCYDCYCIDDPICACNKTVTLPAGETYCTIIRLYQAQHVYIILEHIDRNSSAVYIRDFPFILVDETILYNENTGRWNTQPTLVMFGCNTDYCNEPRLIPRLPINFEMRLPETWLNSSILGSGQPVSYCHECPENFFCGTTDFIDISRCPIQSCNTTCYVADIYEDPEGDFCYQSYCLSPDSVEDELSGHRIEIEGIIYGNIPNATLEFWGIEVYCRADDCSRPELFEELQAQLEANLGDLSAFFNTSVVITITTTMATTTVSTPPSGQTRTCYECNCFDDPICACNKTVTLPAGETYCTIVRLYQDQHVYMILEHIARNSSAVYIRDFPFILVDETILYDENTGQWNTEPTLVMFGCNTDYCNEPRLIPFLPISFEMSLPQTWLNSSILGSGLPVSYCHECPENFFCGTTDFIDISRCPIQSCNTTCYVADIYEDPEGDFCYQSYCVSPDSDEDELSGHRLEIEGIIYGNVPNASLEFWGIEIYCRADNCSRLELFQELQAQLEVNIGDLSAFFNTSAVVTTTMGTTTISIPPSGPTITCYDCYCYDNPNCSCDRFTVANASSSYCTIIRQNFDHDDFLIVLEHISRNSTRVYIQEFPYLLVEESILYNETTGQWYTRNNLVIFGCNTSYCNHPSLVPYLPDTFQMRLPETWLNSNILSTGQPVGFCHECPDGPQCGTLDFLDSSRCPIQSCNTTCVVSDLFDIPNNNEQCYQSFCAPPDSDFFTIDPHRVEMEGILYLYPMGRPVEIWEVDIFCRANDCSRPEIFDEIRAQFTTVIGNISIFYTNITTTTSTAVTTTSSPSTISGTGTTTASSTISGTGTTTASSTTPGTGTTTASSTNPGTGTTTAPSTNPGTGTTTTTTRSAGPSTYATPIILIICFYLISLFNLY